MGLPGLCLGYIRTPPQHHFAQLYFIFYPSYQVKWMWREVSSPFTEVLGYFVAWPTSAMAGYYLSLAFLIVFFGLCAYIVYAGVREWVYWTMLYSFFDPPQPFPLALRRTDGTLR